MFISIPRCFQVLLAVCLLAACGTAPGPRLETSRREVLRKAEARGLVEVRKAVPGIRTDLRYATAENVTGRPLYPKDMPCLLRASTARRLRQAQEQLARQGLGLCIWDAWRPLEAHERLYGKGRNTGLFLNPQHGWSRHCGGVSVDVTLVDSRGQPLPMPTGFDEASGATASSAVPVDSAVRKNLAALQAAMSAAGFQALPGEWWHFDDLEFLYHPVPAFYGRELGIHIE